MGDIDSTEVKYVNVYLVLCIYLHYCMNQENTAMEEFHTLVTIKFNYLEIFHFFQSSGGPDKMATAAAKKAAAGAAGKPAEQIAFQIEVETEKEWKNLCRREGLIGKEKKDILRLQSKLLISDLHSCRRLRWILWSMYQHDQHPEKSES